MQNGDIDNRLPPRWLVVFEGVIGQHPEITDREAYDFYLRLRAHKRAVRTFKPNTHSIKVLWDLTWRQDYKFDVATFLPERCTNHVTAWLAQRNVPCANVRHYPSPAHLGQELAFMPDVYAVVHAEPGNRFTYGNRGMLVSEGWNT